MNRASESVCNVSFAEKENTDYQAVILIAYLSVRLCLSLLTKTFIMGADVVTVQVWQVKVQPVGFEHYGVSR